MFPWFCEVILIDFRKILAAFYMSKKCTRNSFQSRYGIPNLRYGIPNLRYRIPVKPHLRYGFHHFTFLFGIDIFHWFTGRYYRSVFEERIGFYFEITYFKISHFIRPPREPAFCHVGGWYRAFPPGPPNFPIPSWRGLTNKTHQPEPAFYVFMWKINDEVISYLKFKLEYCIWV